MPKYLSTPYQISLLGDPNNTQHIVLPLPPNSPRHKGHFLVETHPGDPRREYIHWAPIRAKRMTPLEAVAVVLSRLAEAAKSSKAMNLKKVFQKYDADGGGSIDEEELNLVLKEFHVLLDEEQLSQVFSIFDENNTGSISYLEFVYAMFNRRAFIKKLEQQQLKKNNGSSDSGGSSGTTNQKQQQPQSPQSPPEEEESTERKKHNILLQKRMDRETKDAIQKSTTKNKTDAVLAQKKKASISLAQKYVVASWKTAVNLRTPSVQRLTHTSTTNKIGRPPPLDQRTLSFADAVEYLHVLILTFVTRNKMKIADLFRFANRGNSSSGTSSRAEQVKLDYYNDMDCKEFIALIRHCEMKERERQRIIITTTPPPMPRATYLKIMHRIDKHVKSHMLKVTSIFQQFDRSGDGCLSKAEFRKGVGALLSKASFTVTPHEINGVFATIDCDGSNEVSYEEFANELNEMAMARTNTKMPPETTTTTTTTPPMSRTTYLQIMHRIDKHVKSHLIKVLSIFQQFDRSGDGCLSKAEFRKGVGAILSKASFTVTPQEINGVFATIDCDGSNEVSYEEFAKEMKESDPVRQASLAKKLALKKKQRVPLHVQQKLDREAKKQKLAQSKALDLLSPPPVLVTNSTIAQCFRGMTLQNKTTIDMHQLDAYTRTYQRQIGIEKSAERTFQASVPLIQLGYRGVTTPHVSPRTLQPRNTKQKTKTTMTPNRPLASRNSWKNTTTPHPPTKGTYTVRQGRMVTRVTMSNSPRRTRTSVNVNQARIGRTVDIQTKTNTNNNNKSELEILHALESFLDFHGLCMKDAFHTMDANLSGGLSAQECSQVFVKLGCKGVGATQMGKFCDVCFFFVRVSFCFLIGCCLLLSLYVFLRKTKQCMYSIKSTRRTTLHWLH